MSHETLKGLLGKLHWAEGTSSLPPDEGKGGHSSGLWAVKWVQGAVAGGATRVVISCKRGELDLDLFGDFPTSAQKLAEASLRDHVPIARAERHLVMAVRHARHRKLDVKLMSRRGQVKQIVTIDRRGGLQVSEAKFEGGSGNLSLTVDPPQKASLLAGSPWAAELAALRTRLRYCHLPITLEKAPISQQTVYHDSNVLMSWGESAMGDEASFRIFGDPKQILAPHLVKPETPEVEIRRCSLMVTLRSGRQGTGSAKVWWIKDGALIGPVSIVGPTGVLGIEIVCAGDKPGELSEWAARDPWSFFPDKLVLTVVRRLAGGLDTLLPELVARETFVGSLMRQANAATGFRNLLPVAGRPCLALSGPFHASLKAFSLRNSLELVPG